MKKAVLLILVGFAILVTAWIGIPIVRKSSIETEITQNLPVGSDNSAVIAFLNARHIAHSEYYPDKGKIYAGVSRSRLGLLRARLHIEFDFDAKGRLTSHRVAELIDFL